MPDVLVQSHSASLCMTFYTGSQFPEEYRLDAFAAEHGSWNRARRTGYKVIRIPMKDGKATGEYEDFLVGFVTPEGNVWGRPVGVTVAKDGALLVTDDGSGIVWRVAYTGCGPEVMKTTMRSNDHGGSGNRRFRRALHVGALSGLRAGASHDRCGRSHRRLPVAGR